MSGVLPVAPAGLGASQSIWDRTVAEFELTPHEERLLGDLCRTADLVDELQAQVDADGLMSTWGETTRTHPALAEVRAQRLVLARLSSSLGVDGEDGRTRRGSAGQTTRGLGRVRRGDGLS